jgi:hypothetical protein
MSYVSPFTGDVIQPTDVSFRSITMSVNTQLSWPVTGSTTDNSTARIMEVTATVGGLRLIMPAANQVSVGQDALIRNVGAQTFTVVDFDNNVIISVAAGTAKYIYIETNPDEAGTWGNIAFGVGSSAADAATLAGYGLLAITTTLNQSHPVTTFAASTSATAAFRAQTYVWTGGAGILTLGLASVLGNNWFTLIKNGGTGLLDVNTSGADLFDGSSTISLQQGDSCMICCSGTAFYSVGLGRSTLFNFTQLTKPVVSGSYTLTSAEASNVIQKYTGTLTGNVTIIVPQTVQVYYTVNETVGGASNFTVTVSTGVAGAATATIPAGQQSILLCDSANLLNANSVIAGGGAFSLVDGLVASPSLSFASEASTGVYRPAAGQFAISVLGTNRFTLSATGLAIAGTGNFTSGISGGTFT